MHLEQLAQLKPLAKDPNFQRAVMKVKQENKLRLAALLEKDYGVKVNVASIFDIQVCVAFVYSFLFLILYSLHDVSCEFFRSNVFMSTNVSC